MKRVHAEIKEMVIKKVRPTPTWYCQLCHSDTSFWEKNELVTHIMDRHLLTDILKYVD
jgi:hypothetical protein